MEQVDLPTFYDMLARHDWYYAFSDDRQVYRAGYDERRRLDDISETSPEHLELMRAWIRYMFSGSAWGTLPQPKPERPERETINV